jgi:hypothetical protein
MCIHYVLEISAKVWYRVRAHGLPTVPTCWPRFTVNLPWYHGGSAFDPSPGDAVLSIMDTMWRSPCETSARLGASTFGSETLPPLTGVMISICNGMREAGPLEQRYA